MMNVLNDIMRNVLVFMFTGALISPSFSESVARWLNCILSSTVEKSYVMERKTAPSSCAYCRLFFLNATEITIRIPVYVQITYLFKPYSSGSKGLNLSRGWIISGRIARHDSFFSSQGAIFFFSCFKNSVFLCSPCLWNWELNQYKVIVAV